MESQSFKLDAPPVIEAIIDIDCDLPPDLDFNLIEQKAKKVLEDTYPNIRRKMFHGQSLLLIQKMKKT